MRATLLWPATVIAIVGTASGLCGAASAAASSDKPVIALSNAYYGNIWRHQMVDAVEAAAK